MFDARPYAEFLLKSSGFSSLILGVFLQLQMAQAQDVDFIHNQNYKACIQQAHQKPEDAFETALDWEDRNGGLPARHCAAIALFTLEQYAEAAVRLQSLAKEMPETVSAQIVSDILGQAGLALYLDGQLSAALDVQNSALNLQDNNITILIDRALTFMDLGKIPETIEDLNKVLTFEADNLEALVYRGSAYRQAEKFNPALADFDRVLALEPTNAEALLERGIVYRLQGNKEAARADWLKLVEYHDGRPVADIAQRNIQKMELGED